MSNQRVIRRLFDEIKVRDRRQNKITERDEIRTTDVTSVTKWCGRANVGKAVITFVI